QALPTERTNCSCCTLLCVTLHSRAIQNSVLTVESTNTAHSKKALPLIAPHVNPFWPSAISTVSVLVISTDQCIGVTGDVSYTKSVPSSVRMPAAVPL
ncbi:unnamed protein product, partial [Staurois parvus]